MTLSSNLVSIAFAIFTGTMWVYRKNCFFFIANRITTVRDVVNGAQRQRLEALMYLKQTRARNGVVMAEGTKIIERSREEANDIMLHSEEKIRSFINANNERASRLAKQKHRALILLYKRIAIHVAVETATALLHRNKDSLNTEENIEKILSSDK